MSNHLAIATVTAVLRQILDSEVNTDVTGTTVSILPPDDQTIITDTNLARLNIFLYQVSPSAAWRGIDLPGRRADGSLAQRPLLGIDLYYLLTAYGGSSATDPQMHRILGSAVRALHTRPQLSRTNITDAIDLWVQGDPQHPLRDSNLAAQPELVKFSPVSLNLEELSKLWSVFFQTAYRPSVAYQASVVLMESRDVVSPSLPVRERGIYVMPFKQPRIESLSPQFEVVGGTLSIWGRNLKSQSMQVLIGGEDVPLDPQNIRDTKIDVLLPVQLLAGVNTVKVVHEIQFTPDTGPHSGAESNTAVFILRPVINAVPQNVVNGDGEIVVDFDPEVERRQQVSLLLNQLNPPPGQAPFSYRLPAPTFNGISDPNIEKTAQIVFPFEEVEAGTYLVRALVDGAESELQTNPVTGLYEGPVVII